VLLMEGNEGAPPARSARPNLAEAFGQRRDGGDIICIISSASASPVRSRASSAASCDMCVAQSMVLLNGSGRPTPIWPRERTVTDAPSSHAYAR